MIELELTQALALYSTLLAMLVIGIWLYTEVSVRRPQRDLGKQFLWRCIFCGCTYLDESAQALSRCPRCTNFNSTEENPARKTDPRATAAPDSTAPEEKGRNTSKRGRKHQRRRGPRRRGR